MALKAAPEDQALLLDLQALDTKLQQIGHRASHLPEVAAVTAIAGERDGLQRTLSERTGVWEDARAELGRVESDVAVVEARVARDKDRLQATSSVKDVQALEQELAALAKRQSDLEDTDPMVRRLGPSLPGLQRTPPVCRTLVRRAGSDTPRYSWHRG